jgi:hypothetical protein
VISSDAYNWNRPQKRPIVEDMLSMHPENPIGSQMLDFIWQTTGR